MKRILLLTIFFLSACSFNSSQYNFVRNQLSNGVNPNIPEKNWRLKWVDQTIDVYAINLKSQVIFADNNVNILFNGGYIYKVTGLLQQGAVINITINEQEINYFYNSKLIARHICESAKVFDTREGSRKRTQRCYKSEDSESYLNEIVYNSDNFVISLRYIIHPDYPALSLSKI